MAGPTDRRSAAQAKAHKHFAASERRDATFKETIERDRAARDSKNEKLRALRLAKEAEEAVLKAAELERLANEPPPVKKPRKSKAKRAPAEA